MGRKVTENHKVVEQSSQGAAEDLIKQQNAAEDFVLGEREEESQAADAGKEEGQQKNVFERTVVLTGAATYMDAGIRYFKNKPTNVTDQKAYEQLLRTGLFVRI